jgi:beta-lactamase class A
MPRLPNLVICWPFWFFCMVSGLNNVSVAAEHGEWPELESVLRPLVQEADERGVRLAVGVRDLSDPNEKRTALVGSPESYHPASTIKMLLIATLMTRVDAGSLSLNDTATIGQQDVVGGYGVLQHESIPQQVSLGRLAELTVTISDNTATNALVDAVGYETMRALAKSLGLEVMQFGRKMFEPGIAPDRENYINSGDALELLTQIYQGTFLTQQSRDRILDWMAGQTVKTKIAAGVPHGVTIAHKTGENGPVSHDIGYLLLPGKEVAIVIFSEARGETDFESAQLKANPIVANVAAVVYAFLATQ